MSSRQSLQYSALKQPSSFRLLRVQQLKSTEYEDAPLKCTLDHYTLADDKHPEYAALSYCWGNPKDTEEIVVNGAVTSVTVSLVAALRQLRHDELPDEIYIWADALCINQKDMREKAKQIQLMPKIYARATKVVTWLSQEDRDAEHMSFLNTVLSRNLNRHREQTALSRAISTLSSKDYWSRIWIVQELSLAAKIEVVCKDRRIPWSKFVQVACGHVAQTLSPTSEDTGFAFLSDSRILELDLMRNDVQNKVPMPTLRALYRTRTCQSTIKADRVFAVLGLTVDGLARSSKLRYQDSVNVTLINLTVAELEESGRLDLITFADKRDNGTSVLRSWAPNWISRGLWQRLRVWQLNQITHNGEYFRATAPLGKLRLDPNRGELKLSGYCLGSICNKGESVRLRYRNPSSVAAAVDMLITEFPDSVQTEPFQWNIKSSIFGLRPSAKEDDILSVRATGSGIYRTKLEELATALEPLSLRRRISSNDWLISQNSDGDEESSQWIEREPAKYRGSDERFGDELRALLYLGSSYTTNRNGELCIAEMRFTLTSKGLVGLGHVAMQAGDQVYVLDGCSVPVVLRPRKNMFEVVGEILVCGVMRGELQKKGSALLSGEFKAGDKETVTVV